MTTRTVRVLFALLAGQLYINCQPEKQTEATTDIQAKPAVALLNRQICPVGTPVTVRFAQPVTQATVQWEGQPVSEAMVADSLSIRTVNETTGFHQLIVRGSTTAHTAFSDTVTVELLANIVPQERHYAVLKTYPHQTDSFTEGLELYRGELYESTGLNGKSNLLKIDLLTGKPLKTRPLPQEYFGEGITIVRNKIYQLTWTTGVCFRYTLDFVPDKTFTYYTQGWGMTHRDTTLIMSDGSHKLYFYTPDFKRQKELAVYDDKGPVTNLNELEYVDGYVFANIWQTNRIVQIDLKSGMVIAYLDMNRVLPVSLDTKENVLNGIAYQAEDNTLFVTGKNWPTLTKVRLTDLPKSKPDALARNQVH